MSSEQPKWLRDIQQLLPIRTHFALNGAIRDLVLMGANGTEVLVSLESALWRTLQPLGYGGMLVWDMVDGLRGYPPEPERLRELGKLCDRDLTKPQEMGYPNLGELMRCINGADRRRPGSQVPVALVVDFASRIRETSRDEADRFFVTAEKAALSALPLPRGPEQGGVPLFNPVFWLAHRPADIPHWFTGDNERVRMVAVPAPDLDTRKRAAARLWETLHRARRDREQNAFANELARLTDGLSLTALQDVVTMTNRMQLRASDVDDAVRSYRVGDLSNESPWRGQQLRENIRRAETDDEHRIDRRVMGQPRAVQQVLDVLKRTSMGMTAAQSASAASRPRGVLFFVGPTGVGKTELAKAIASIVFGDENAVKRFDMSEFSAEHSGDRLIGAPPGYTGFDQGGELTNAMRERPFRVLLFDEVEKANPLILDKFLQVLEDGRLTDGRGQTVYFSESLIIFTSNRGVSERLQDGTVRYLVSPDDKPEEFEIKLREGVANYFKNTLQRPELLNRIGENIVVFHFITPEVGRKILEKNIKDACRSVQAEHGVEVRVGKAARLKLEQWCVGDQVLNGGRGIGALLESRFTNPLSRLLFALPDARRVDGQVLTVSDVLETPTGYELQVQHS